MILFGFTFDIWSLIGFLGQFIFFMRFALQWYASEKKGYTFFPISFWYYSIIGSIIILVYAAVRKDIVIFSGTVISIFIYIRNLFLSKKIKVD